MSFSIQFTARDRKTARALVKQGNLPPAVQTFLTEALHAVDVDQPVFVKAFGHLYEDGSLNVSTADIRVEPLVFQEPR